MSNFYLCDLCNKVVDNFRNTCTCLPTWPHEHRKRVMLDHHGKGGIRYEETTDVCPSYERRTES